MKDITEIINILEKINVNNKIKRSIARLILVSETDNADEVRYCSSKPEMIAGKGFLNLTREEIEKAGIRGLGKAGVEEAIRVQKYLEENKDILYKDEYIPKKYEERHAREIKKLRAEIKILEENNEKLRERAIEAERKYWLIKDAQILISNLYNKWGEIVKEMGERC